MFFKPWELRYFWSIDPRLLVHVGAHNAEESNNYRRVNWNSVIWIEAQPEKVLQLKEKFLLAEDVVIEAAIWDVPGIQIDLKVSSNSESSSLLMFGSHSTRYPGITKVGVIPVVTKTLEGVLGDSPVDFINLDIQGAELRALKGFSGQLGKVKWIYTEVNSEFIYEGCCLIEELDAYLLTFGFKRIGTRWWSNHGWGDAVYQNTSIVAPSRNLIRNIGRIAAQTRWNVARIARIAIQITRRKRKVLPM